MKQNQRIMRAASQERSFARQWWHKKIEVAGKQLSANMQTLTAMQESGHVDEGKCRVIESRINVLKGDLEHYEKCLKRVE